VTGDPQNGDGSENNPYRTISKAVDRARRIRSHCEDPIVIHVGPGEYFTDSAVEALCGVAVGACEYLGDSSVEALPILLDVPDLELRGSTVLDTDQRGLPTGTFSNASTFTIGPLETMVEPANSTGLIFVGPSYSGRGDRVTVTGFVFSGGMTLPFVQIDRVQGFVVRGNIFTDHFSPAIFTRAASGLIEANYMSNDVSGAALTGGNADFPSNVVVNGNRFVENGLGDADRAGLFINGTGDNTLSTADLRVPFSGTEVFDTIVATVTGNDFSNNLVGIQLIETGIVGASPTPLHAHVTAIVSDNTLDKNDIGVVMDAGLPFRGASLYHYTGSLDATFHNNVVSNSSTSPAFLSFTRYRASQDPEGLVLGDTLVLGYEYLQNSTYTVTHTGELAGLLIDHPVQDPVDCRTLCNDLQINGVAIPRGTRSTELGPPLKLACPLPLPVCSPQL
jgi:hypothetical protein